MKWEPIDTAPKDGSELMGMFSAKRFGLIWYFKRSAQYCGWCDANGKDVSPTHWMPLPEPPE